MLVTFTFIVLCSTEVLALSHYILSDLDNLTCIFYETDVNQHSFVGQLLASILFFIAKFLMSTHTMSSELQIRNIPCWCIDH